MSIYDRDWYRGEQKSPYDNRRVSREGAEKIRRMMEGTSPNEPPKMDPKYRFEFVGSPTGNGEKPSNGYDPTYGCGYESSTVKQSGWYRKRSISMKPLFFIILAVVVGYVIAVSYNVISINNKLNDEFLTKNGLAISIEVGSRLGLAQALGILGNVLSNTTDTSSVWQDNRFLREAVNVLYDWYAPIKWSPVLNVSKKVGWLLAKNKVNKANTVQVTPVNEQKTALDRPVETSSVVREPGYGTTRAHSFQNKYEEAVREYDARMRGVPSGLVLPGGQTVEEAVNSGRVSGK